MSLLPNILLEAFFFMCIQYFVVMASNFRRVRVYSVEPTGRIFVKFGDFQEHLSRNSKLGSNRTGISGT